MVRMLPQRSQGMGTEKAIAPNSTSGAKKTFLHAVQMNSVVPRIMSFSFEFVGLFRKIPEKINTVSPILSVACRLPALSRVLASPLPYTVDGFVQVRWDTVPFRGSKYSSTLFPCLMQPVLVTLCSRPYCSPAFLLHCHQVFPIISCTYLAWLVLLWNRA